MNPRSERRCDGCGADGENTRLQLRAYCADCTAQMRDRRLYIRIPKPVTLTGLRTQYDGLRFFLNAAGRSLSGRTPAARASGRMKSLQLAASVWIDQWNVLSAAGWRR